MLDVCTWFPVVDTFAFHFRSNSCSLFDGEFISCSPRTDDSFCCRVLTFLMCIFARVRTEKTPGQVYKSTNESVVVVVVVRLYCA